MPHFTIPFDQVNALSNRDVSYQLSPEKFESFYAFEPTLKGLKDAIKSRKNSSINREALVGTLTKQSKDIDLTAVQKENIQKLSDTDTYTVITAHQPSLLTGPAYFVIKILSAIRLAQRLTAEIQEADVVPVFIIGSEDHDFDEINHLNIYGKRVEWFTSQTGPVGRMNLNGLDEAINHFSDIVGESPNAEYLKDAITKSLIGAETYNQFVYRLVNKLFGQYGLIIANMDDSDFKKSFAPFMIKELIERKSEGLIKATQDQLDEIGYSSQAFPREINLFYMTPGSRERIIYEDGRYSVLNTNLSWNEDEIKSEVNNHPENFSPNVVMRPIYQEVIWPNIAYIGGGGELAYWLERKSQFEYFGVHFPALVRRNSLMIVNKGQVKTMEKLGFELPDLFREEHELITEYLHRQTSFDLDLNHEISEFEKVFESITKKASLADKSLEGFAEAEKTRIVKQIQQIESRIKRSVKKQEETSVNQIKNLKEKLFPNNGLQERHDNFFQFYLSGGPALYDKLITMLDPLEKGFVTYYDV